MTTRKQLIDEAANLFDPSERLDDVPHHYVRGVCDLIAQVFPVSGQPGGETAEQVRYDLIAARKRE